MDPTWTVEVEATDAFPTTSTPAVPAEAVQLELSTDASGWSVQTPDSGQFQPPADQSSAWVVEPTVQAPTEQGQNWATVASHAAACPQPPPSTPAPAAAASAASETEQQAWAIFGNSVKVVFESWTSLRLAIENNWGGGDSIQKATAFLEEVIQMFKARRSVDPIDLQDFLDSRMDEDFSTELEDNSQKEVRVA